MLIIEIDKIKAFINELTKHKIKCKLNYYNRCKEYKCKFETFVGYPIIEYTSVKENNDECINIIFSDTPIKICKKYGLKQLKRILKHSKNKILKWQELLPCISIEIE